MFRRFLILALALGFPFAVFAVEPVQPPTTKSVLKFDMGGNAKSPGVPVRIERDANSFELVLFLGNAEINRISLQDWMDRVKFMAGLEELSKATADRRALEEAGQKIPDDLKEEIQSLYELSWRQEAIYARLRDQLHGLIPCVDSKHPDDKMFDARQKLRISLAVLPFFMELDGKGDFTNLTLKATMGKGNLVSDIFTRQNILDVRNEMDLLQLTPLIASINFQPTKIFLDSVQKRGGAPVKFVVGMVSKRTVGLFIDGKLIGEMPITQLKKSFHSLLLLHVPGNVKLIAEKDPVVKEHLEELLAQIDSSIRRGQKKYDEVAAVLDGKRPTLVNGDEEHEVDLNLFVCSFLKDKAAHEEDLVQLVLDGDFEMEEGKKLVLLGKLALALRDLQQQADRLERNIAQWVTQPKRREAVDKQLKDFIEKLKGMKLEKRIVPGTDRDLDLHTL